MERTTSELLSTNAVSNGCRAAVPGTAGQRSWSGAAAKMEPQEAGTPGTNPAMEEAVRDASLSENSVRSSVARERRPSIPAFNPHVAAAPASSDHRTTAAGGHRQRSVKTRHLQSVAVVGLNEDGVELALQFARLGISVVGIDASSAKVSTIRGDRTVTTALLRKRFAPSTDFSLVRDVDLTVLCIPEGQSDGEIDLALLGTGARLAPQIQRGSLIVIEAISQEHPICGELRSVLEHGSRLEEGRDFKLSFLGPSNGSSNPSARAAEIGLSYQLNGFASAAVVNSEPEFTSGNHNGRELPVSAPVGLRRRMDKDLAERLVNIALLCDAVVIVCTLLCGFWLRFHSGFPLFGTPAKVDLRNYTGYMVYGALSLIIVLGYITPSTAVSAGNSKRASERRTMR